MRPNTIIFLRSGHTIPRPTWKPIHLDIFPEKVLEKVNLRNVWRNRQEWSVEGLEIKECRRYREKNLGLEIKGIGRNAKEKNFAGSDFSAQEMAK